MITQHFGPKNEFLLQTLLTLGEVHGDEQVGSDAGGRHDDHK